MDSKDFEDLKLIMCLIFFIILCSICSNYFLNEPGKLESGWEKVEASVDAYCVRRLFCNDCHKKYNCEIDIEFTPIGSTEKIKTKIKNKRRTIYFKRNDTVIYDPKNPIGTVMLERDEIKSKTIGIVSILFTVALSLFCLYTSFYENNIYNIIKNMRKN